jgi:hypothetical protein
LGDLTWTIAAEYLAMFAEPPPNPAKHAERAKQDRRKILSGQSN